MKIALQESRAAQARLKEHRPSTANGMGAMEQRGLARKEALTLARMRHKAKEVAAVARLQALVRGRQVRKGKAPKPTTDDWRRHEQARLERRQQALQAREAQKQREERKRRMAKQKEDAKLRFRQHQEQQQKQRATVRRRRPAAIGQFEMMGLPEKVRPTAALLPARVPSAFRACHE